MEVKRRLKEIAKYILDGKPDPVVRYRLLRDVLGAEDNEARRSLAQSRWVQELTASQHDDGGWGRFHSQDTSRKSKIPSTEFAVERGAALGLGAGNPVFDRAMAYLVGLLKRELEFPDPPEKNDRWETGKQLFAAATLARIAPGHPALKEALNSWTEIATRAFASGQYDPRAEGEAHRELTGASVSGSYLELHNRYTVALLASHSERMPKEVRFAYLFWLWNHELGFRYYETPLHRPPNTGSPRQVDLWFSSMEVFSRFTGWRTYAGETVEWLWAQREEDGSWDFGSRWARSSYHPLSESWRSPTQRIFDHTTRTLALLAEFYQ